MQEETTDDPVVADVRNFFKVELWTAGDQIERLLYAGSSLYRAREIFVDQIGRGQGSLVTIRQRTPRAEQMARRVRRRQSWLLPLPRPLLIPDVTTVRTLADVRMLIEHHLPKACEERPHRRAVARDLEAAAAGGDPDDVATALMLAFAVEGIACRPTKS